MSSADIFHVQENFDGDLLIYHKPDYRQFTISLATTGKNKYKFTERGFVSLNAKEIIYEKVKLFDFAYILNPTHLLIKLNISNGTKNYVHELVCPETFSIPNRLTFDLSNLFDDTNFNTFMNSPNECRNLFYFMRNRINNLEGQINELKEQIESLKPDNNYPDYEYIN